MGETGLRSYKLAFLLPGLLTLLAIILFPLLFTIRVSASGWNATNPDLDWIGGANYAALWLDARFWQSLGRLSFMATARSPFNTCSDSHWPCSYGTM